MKNSLFVIALTLILFVLALSACSGTEVPYKVVYHRTLSSLTLRSGVEGRFFLATGQVGSEMHYVFTEVQEDGGSYIREISTEEAIYYEDAVNGEPYVDRVECSGEFYSSCNYQSDPRVPEAFKGLGKYGWYEIHIPPGSVVSTIDLGVK